MQEVCEKNLKHVKLAIVEDSRSFAAGLKAMVEEHVAGVEIYLDGRAALEAFKRSSPDIIITDLEMPGFDGYELVAAVREISSLHDTPLLVLTEKEDTATMAQIIGLGADAFVVKSNVRETLIVHLLALARFRDIYRRATQGKQLEAVKALIGTYKHEFGNAIAVIDGKLRKLKKEHPHLTDDPSYQTIMKWTDHLIETLQKLDRLRNYEEKEYVGASQIIKTG